MKTCRTCMFWNAGGSLSCPIDRFDDNGEQMFARPCQFMPKPVPKYHDEWCGQHKDSESTKLREIGTRILEDKI